MTDQVPRVQQVLLLISTDEGRILFPICGKIFARSILKFIVN